MPVLKYFFRHPDVIYFSLEKLFQTIGKQVAGTHPSRFGVENCFMPYPTSWKKIAANIAFTKRQQADINHITGDIHYAILGCSRKKVNVLTIHDCVILHRYPAWHPRYRILKWLWYDLPVKRADAVTVISEQTKKELLHFTKCDPRKIRVIPDFVDPAFRSSPYSFGDKLPNILFIGSTPNKNLDRLIGAITGLTIRLIIVGRISDQQKGLLEQHGVDYHQSSGLSEEEMVETYRRCDVLAFPSTYEGFGLPIIEAQAIGRPVLTSDLPPMNAVAGNAACLVDPYDTRSIREGLLSILEKKDYREKLVEKGLVNVERFRPGKVTEEYVALYNELIEQKSTH